MTIAMCRGRSCTPSTADHDFFAAFSLGAPMSLSGNLGKSGSDFFAKLFTTGTVSSDVSQNSPSDTPSVPTGSSNPGPNGTTAQSERTLLASQDDRFVQRLTPKAVLDPIVLLRSL